MKPWRSSLVRSNLSFGEAVKILDEAGLRIALIVDEEDKLVGTLTDGDVRRALLDHVSFETSVVKVMNRQPKVVEPNWPKGQVMSEMQQYGLLQLPVVNSGNQVVDLVSLQDILNKQHYSNPVFIMAGGFGTRLRPLTNNCPKPMLKIGDKPILEQIILNFIDAGFHRFFISTHYMPEVIHDYFGDGQKWGVQIQYVHEQKPLGTGGALGLLPHNEIDEPIFMMNGDVLTSLNLHGFLDFHQAHNGVATMCVREYEYQVPYGVIASKGIQITSMVEKPVQRFFINAGIYMLSPDLVKAVKPGIQIDMPTLLEQQIHAGNVVNMFPIHEYWQDIGRADDFNRAQQEFEDGEFLK